MEYVVFDIETTGLNTMRDRIVEIGAVKVRDGEIVSTFDMLMNPGIKIPSEVSLINHITDDMVMYALPSQVVLHQFQKFVDGCDFLVGHNAARFDYPFLLSEFERNNVHHQRLPVRDTVFLAKNIVPHLKRYSLASLCEYFKIVNNDAHRALSDAEATSQLFSHLQRVKQGL
ncbi:MAG: 3'-5' exonuclease [Candidatus Izemoplasmataceae bacterium]